MITPARASSESDRGSRSLDQPARKARPNFLKRTSDQSVPLAKENGAMHSTAPLATSLHTLPVADHEGREEWPGTPKPGRSRVDRLYAMGLSPSMSSLRSRLSNKSGHRTRHKDSLYDEDDGAKPWAQPLGSIITRGSVATACGYTLASDKRDDDFHALFLSVPPHDGLVEDYKCALHKDILLQGHMYVSEHHLCFKSNIFGYVTNLVLAYSEITHIEKRMTARIIPNGIEITTATSKHVFASFLLRDQAFLQMTTLWQLYHPTREIAHEEESVDASDQWTLGGSSDTSDMDPIHMSESTITHHDATPSTEPISVAPPEPKETSHATTTTTPAPPLASSTHAPQSCPCEHTKSHYAHVALDGSFPGSVETMYRLLHDSDFIKRYLEKEGYGQDVSMGEWRRGQRRGWYSKRCASGSGPSLTPCNIKEERIYYHLPHCTVVDATTQTPDRSMGSVYAIKTRTCITRQAKAKVHVLVTCKVEFTQSGLSSSIIEKEALDEPLAFYRRLHSVLRRTNHLQAFTNDHQLSKKLKEEEAKAIEASHSTVMRLFVLFHAFVVRVPSYFSAPRVFVALIALIVVSNLITARKLQNVSLHLDTMRRAPARPGPPSHPALLDMTWVQVSMTDMHDRLQEMQRETEEQRHRLTRMMAG